MQTEFASLLTIIGPTVVFSAGAAWGGAYMALNGVKKKVERIEPKVDKLAEDMAYLKGHEAARQSIQTDR